MPNRSKYHLREIYRDTEVLFRSIIGAFFVLKVLLTLKNHFRLINESADIMLISQMNIIRSSRDNFKRYRES